MSFQSYKEKLENEFAFLKKQESLTRENWKDSVQNRFYKEYINDLPAEFQSYVNALDKLEEAFQRAENNIEELRTNRID